MSILGLPLLRRGRRSSRLALLLALTLCALGPAAAGAAPQQEEPPLPHQRLSPERGARYCHERGLLCFGVSDVAAAGGMLAWAQDTARNRQQVIVRPVSAGAPTAPAATVAVERGIQRSDVLEVAAAGIPSGGAIVAWDKWEQEAGGAGRPMIVRARRVSASGAATGRSHVLARVPRHGDEPELEGDDVPSQVSLAAAGAGVLAGWQTPGSPKRAHDRVGVVLALDDQARPRRGAKPRAVTDRGADDLTLAARPGGFIASWTRPQRIDRDGVPRGLELRFRLLEPSGRRAGPPVTALRLSDEEAGLWATPVLAVRGEEVLVARARHRTTPSDGIDLRTRRLTLDGRRVGGDSVVARIDERATEFAVLSLEAAADGGWLLASATIGISSPESYERKPGAVHALRLREDGSAASAPVLVSRQAAPEGASLAWDTASATLAFTSSPSFWALPRLHVAAIP